MEDKRLLGFVLRYRSYLEGHKIITLFTRSYGKLSVVAHGVRKMHSRYGGSFELLNEVSLIVSRSRRPSDNLFTVKECELEFSVHNLRESYSCIGNLYYVAEFLNCFVQESSRDADLYDLLKATLNFASRHADCFYELTRMFELKSLSLFGFLPSLKHCSMCGIALPGGDKDFYRFDGGSGIYVSNFSGWIFCANCKVTGRDKELRVRLYRLILDLYNSSKFSDIFNLRVDKRIRFELNAVFNKLINSVIGRSLLATRLLS